MKTFILLFILFVCSYSQIVRTYTQSDTTSSTNTIKPFTDVFPCTCDYFANSCDVYCCCDTDCTEAKRTAWTNQELCTNSGNKTGAFFQQCPDESILSLLVSPKGQQSVTIQQYSTIFCIDYSMVPYSGYFYVEDKAQTHGTVVTHASATTTTTSTAETYSRGQNIYSTSTTDTAPASSFLIPKPNPFGICEETYSARYLEDLPSTSCTKQIILDAANTNGCRAGSPLSVAYYITGGSGTSTISRFPSQSASSVSITSGNIILADGTIPASTIPTPGTSATGCICNNVVAAIDYYFTYDISGLITAAKADFILHNIQSSSPCSTLIGLDQSFGVHFVTTSGTVVSKSGNPGYILGLPLLVGTSATSFVNRLMSGFHIQGITTSGGCALSTSASGDSAYRADLVPKFGQNTSLTCQLTVAATTDWPTYCTSTDLRPQILLFQNFGPTRLIGRFGSSNVHYISDWLGIEQPSAAPVATTGTNTCSLPDDEIYVFYSEFGLASNPLNYIVKVVRKYNIRKSFSTTGLTAPVTLNIKYIKITSKDLD